MKVPTIISKRARLSVVTVAALAALAGTSQATHWSQEGGGETRPGFQPVDPAQLPIEFRAPGSEDDVPNLGSPVVTGGATLADQRIAHTQEEFFTNGNFSFVQVSRFDNGAVVADAEVDDAPVEERDAWGTRETVSPVVAAEHGSPGQIYALHNDDDATDSSDQNLPGNDISLAQINPADGAVVRDRPIGGGLPIPTEGGTQGLTLESTPAISGVIDGNGTQLIAGLARNSDATEKVIVLVSVPAAAAPGAHTPTTSISVNIPDANLFATPSFVRLRDKTGGRVLMVAVPTNDGIKTFRYNNLTAQGAGPSITGLGPTQTISSPVRSDGSTPASVTCALPAQCSAPLYVASQTPGEGTIVRKLMQDESNVFDPDRLLTLRPYCASFNQNQECPDNSDSRSVSPELPGKPGRALAVQQNIPTAGAGANTMQPGRVIVNTAKNVITLDTENLANPDFKRVFATDREIGFEKTAPAASGGLGFTSDNKGQQFVFYTDPADPRNTNEPTEGLRVQPDETGFMPNAGALNSTSSISQPAVSRGRVVFAADNGFFIYGPNVAIVRPGSNAAVAGNTVPLEAYVFNPNLNSVTFYVDNQPVPNGTDAVNDDRTFSVVWDSFQVLDGPHVVRAEATDGSTTERSANRTFIVNNFLNPTAALTVSPKPANPDTDVTLDASGSLPTPGEMSRTPNQPERIERWAFELDGDNDYNDVVETAAGGGDGRITHRFEPGKRIVGVRVTDSNGDIAQKTDTLRVNAPPAANFAVGPNPAAEGQEVTLDASNSTDVDGSIVAYDFDLDGNGSFEQGNGTNPKVQRVFPAGTTKVGVRVTDNENASSVVTADLVVNAKPGNQVPVASFVATPNPAKTDQRVLFDARGARDPDGLVARYEWDLDGNGTFETNSQNNPRVQRSYSTAKVYNVKLRVTDNLGALSTVFTGTVTVTRASRPLPRRLTAKVTPMRDATLPYDYRTTGKLTRPSGITAKVGCTGRVTVAVKAGKRTISRRTTRLRSNCTYRTSVRFRDTERFGTAKALKFTARFQGNKALRARQATSVRVRFG